MRSFALPGLVLFALATACSSDASPTAAAGKVDGALAPYALPCPPTLPAEGTACSLTLACDVGCDGFDPQCEYGYVAGSEYCSTIMACHAGTWTSTYFKANGCHPYPGPGCPATPTSIAPGYGCSAHDVSCTYPGVYACLCAGDPDSPTDDYGWECDGPMTNCPFPRPQVGTSCAIDPSVRCEYTKGNGEQASLEPTLACIDGVWLVAE